MTEPLLTLSGLEKAYGALRATDNVDLVVRAGEIHALIGPNGAGKTTLVSQIAGEIQPDSGSIQFQGREVVTLPVHQRAKLGMARTFQITNLFSGLTVAENMALAVQATRAHSFRFWSRADAQPGAAEKIKACLSLVKLGHKADALASGISHGEKRQLAIAMALAAAPKLLLLDEPAAGMGKEASRELAGLLASLRSEYGILLVEHDMDLVFSLADRISVLVYGRIIATGRPEEIRNNPEVNQAYLGKPMLELNRISTAYGTSQVLFDLDLRVEAGEMVALMGRNGMGKTSSIRCVMGLNPVTGGEIRFKGREITGLASHVIAGMGIGLVPEGRGVFSRLSVRENLIAFARPGPWGLERVYQLFPVLEERGRHLGGQISGGEQQMLAMGRALMTNPNLLILDEATEGLAPIIRDRIWECLAAIKKSGISVLVVDKNINRVAACCDRIYVLEKGRGIWEGCPRDLEADARFVHQALGI